MVTVSSDQSLDAEDDPPPQMLGELASPVEMAQLLADPVYYGWGVPRGNGSPVLVLPGFMGNDLYLLPLRGWLNRIGYRAYASELGRNVGCPNRLGKQLVARAERITQSTGCKVSIIGHSKGGLLARAVAATRPDLLAQVIALGAPFSGSMKAHPFTQSLVDLARQGERSFVEPEYRDSCYTADCTCQMVRAFRGPFPRGVRFTSIYSRTDGVVYWRHCVDTDVNNNVEVQGTHTGLAFNSQVFRHLARLLALVPAQPIMPSSV
jgi:pimeloyl-ACP methyl ester carboxylesterase